MDLRGDLAVTRAVSQTAAVSQVSPVGDIRQDVYARLMTLALGRPVAAEVVSRTDSGASMVRVADTVVQMDLPPDAKAGEKVTLTLLAREPRLTFLFEREPAAHSMVSNTGRLIDSILRSVSQQGNSMPATLTGRVPLFSTPASSTAATALLSQPGLAATLEAALSNLMDTSGLFYESHLAQWIAGERPQAALMAEPQARMQPPAAQEETQGAAREKGASDSSRAANGGAARPAAFAPEDQMDRLERLQEKSWVQTLVDKAASRLSGGTAQVQQQEAKPSSVVDAHAAQMIRMQLDTLEQRKIVWQGEFWPGQKLEWEVEDKTPRRQHKESVQAAEKSWQSVLRVNLPFLGPVTATMKLAGEAVQVQIGAGNEDALSLLRQFGPELAAALENAGARLDFFTVNDEAA